MKVLVAADADNTVAKRNLLNNYESIGDVLLVLNRPDEALADYREAQALAKALVAKDASNNDWQRDLAVST
jgi:hypothetical protein